jgi:ABC-2 type transport system permease protein
MSTVSSEASPVGPASTITDVSYRNYDGELRTRAVRWWTIAVATMRANVNRKKMGYWIPAGIIFVMYLFLGIMFYFTQNIKQSMEAMGSMMAGPANPYALSLYQGTGMIGLLLFVATLTIGSASIAADNRANALLVYLSKPLTRTDYLIGKWVGIFLLLAALSLIPALLLFFFFAVAYNDMGFLKENPTLILRVIAASLVAPAIHASLIIGFSAWSKSPRLAGSIYAAFYFVVAILTGVVGGILVERDKEGKHSAMNAIVANLSVEGVSKGIAMNLYDVTPQQMMERFQGGGRRRNRDKKKTKEETIEEPKQQSFQVPDRPGMLPMLLIGGAMIALPLFAASAKVRAVEIIKG